jgi:MFS-type transporter involved in bile tolerance (Atg22 family)
MNALVADIVPAKNMGMGFSIYFLTDGITTSIAPILVAAVIEVSAASIILPFSAFFMFLTLIVFHFVPPSRN